MTATAPCYCTAGTPWLTLLYTRMMVNRKCWEGVLSVAVLFALCSLVACSGRSTGSSSPTPPMNEGITVNGSTYSSLDTALAACPEAGNCTLQFSNGTWPTQFYSGNKCISRSDLTLHGAGLPQLDSLSAPSRLVGGTIIQPGLAFCGASNVEINDLGVDDGPAYFAATGIATNGIQFEGATGAHSDPLVTNIAVTHEIALGSSSNAQFHGNLFEHAKGVSLSDLTAVFNTHCNVIKSQDVVAKELRGIACSNDAGVLIKSDGYTAVSNVQVDDISASAITSGDVASAVIVDAMESNSVSKVTITHVRASGTQFGINFFSNSSLGQEGLKDISISDVNAVLSNSPQGRTPSCIVSQTNSADHQAKNIHIANYYCENDTPLAAAPIEIYNDWINSTIENWTSVNGGYCSTLGGTIDITGWADQGSGSTVPTFCTLDSSTLVNVTGYSSTRGNSPYGQIAPGSVLKIY